MIGENNNEIKINLEFEGRKVLENEVMVSLLLRKPINRLELRQHVKFMLGIAPKNASKGDGRQKLQLKALLMV